MGALVLPLGSLHHASGLAPDALLDIGLEFIAREGWPAFRPARLALSGVSLPEIYSAFPDRAAFLAQVMARVDRLMLAGLGDPTGTGSARDRLFELLMGRFDALQANRPSIVSIFATPPSPSEAAILFRCLQRSMGWILDAAELSAGRITRLVQTQILAATYLKLFRTWLSDDSTDLGVTMSAVDKSLDPLLANLARADTMLQRTKFLTGRRGGNI